MRAPLHVLGLAACLGGCAANEEPSLQLRRVVPAEIAHGIEARVRVEGDGLRPAVTTRFGGPRPSTLDAEFQIALRDDTAGAHHPLTAVQLEEGALEASVPLSVPRGSWTVEVTAPDGERVTLADAFRVLSPAEAVRGFVLSELGPQQRGVPFTVELRAVDADGATVEGFEGTVALTDGTGAAAPAQLGPFRAGRLNALAWIAARTPGTTLAVADDRGNRGESNPFPVVSAAPVAVKLAPAQPSAIAGTCGALAVTLTDGAGEPVEAADPLQVALSSTSSEISFYSDSGCADRVTTITLPAGSSSAQLSWRAVRAGTFNLRGASAWLPSANVEVQIAPAPPSQVAFESGSPTFTQGVCGGPLHVGAQDAYGNRAQTATGVTVTLGTSGGPGVAFYSDAACASPIQSVAFQPSEGRAAFYLRGSAPGSGLLVAEPSSVSQLSGHTLPFAISP